MAARASIRAVATGVRLAGCPRLRRLLFSPWLPAGLIATVLALDAVGALRAWPVVVVGALDEPAHLATAAVLLLAAADRRKLARHQAAVLTALACSMAIDVDHLPVYLGAERFADGGRPATHSLLTVGTLLVAAALARRARPVLLGAATGVCLHFVRDLGTGPGLPLLFPFTWAEVRVPYPVYVGLLAAAGVAATVRLRRQGRRMTPGAHDR